MTLHNRELHARNDDDEFLVVIFDFANNSQNDL